MPVLTLDIQRATSVPGIPGDELLQQWASQALLGHEDNEVTLRIVTPEESADLNLCYRQKPSATNVLSFPFEVPAGLPVSLLGDLVICADVVADEAREQGKSLKAHWAHMVIHGMLHLQGHDHIEPDDADIMETLEIRLLAALGFPDPYQTDPDYTEDREPHS